MPSNDAPEETRPNGAEEMMSGSLASVTIDLGDSPSVDKRRLSDGWTGALLHGFGATANDLVPLAPELAVARRWEFPHAPVPITVAGMSYGRAWFPRKEDQLQQALFGTYFQNLRAMEPEGLAEAARAVRALMDERGVRWDHLILGGFSQGAMVVAEILRQGASDRRLPLPAVALLFSGALIAESWWTDVKAGGSTTVKNGASTSPGGGAESPALGGTGLLVPKDVLVFQSHGTDDGILPFAEGIALSRTLGDAGFEVNFAEFSGGHGIPDSIVGHIAGILKDRLK